MNHDRLINRLVAYRQKPFIQILQRTIFALYPLVLVGSFSWLIYANLLAPNGFLGRFFRISSWLPFRQFFQQLFSDITTVTVGWISTYAALVAAILTTKFYHKDNLSAGFVGMSAYVLIFYHSVRGAGQLIEMRYYGAGWVIVGVLVGYIVGRLFVRFGAASKFVDFEEWNGAVMQNILQNIKPILWTMVGAFAIHLCYALYRQFGLDQVVAQNISSLLSRNSNYLLNIILSLINTVLVWLGFAEPLSSTSSVYSNEMYSNLAYALTHNSPWKIPYPFTPSSLYRGFALFGGVGVTLALIIGILWIRTTRRKQKIAVASMVPTFFNINLPIMFGTSVFLNPLYLLPFVLLPLFNIIVGSFVIYIHLMPPLVYPVPSGTPGILTAFIATGGNWVALLVSIVLLIIDVAAYIPFIKLAERVEQIIYTKKGDDSHAHD